MLVDHALEVVFRLAGCIGDEHDILALLAYVVSSLLTEDCDPKRWVRLLKRGHRNPGVLDVVVEAVIGKWFTLPGLHHNLQRFVKASPLLPGCKIEPLEFVFQIAGTNPEDKPATSHLIKHSILFGSRKRLVKRQYGDRNAQSDLLRSLGSSS